MADLPQRPPLPLDHPDEQEHRRLIARRANASMPHDGTLPMTAPMRLFSATVATLGTDAYAPELWPWAVVMVTDEAGGAVMAFSDGSNWRRSTDRAVIS